MDTHTSFYILKCSFKPRIFLINMFILTCFFTKSSSTICFNPDFPKLLQYNDNGNKQDIIYYAFDEVDSTKMLIGGSISQGTETFPYFEIQYYTGRSMETNYVPFSALKSIRSIYYRIEGGEESYIMLYDIAPM